MKTISILILLCLTTKTLSSDLYCEVQEKNRINNNTGSQCVFSSIELVGRTIGETKLYNITKLPQCQGLAGPGDVKRLLDSLDVKFEQSNNKEKGRELIKEAMKIGYPVVWGMGGFHALSLVHYDEIANRVHYIDNVGPKTVKICSVEKFNKMWDGWIIYIHGGNKERLNHKLKNRKIRMWYYND